MPDEPNSTTALEQVADPATETAPADAGSTAPAEGAEPAPQQETFFDPKTLSPELQVQWKKMQGAYTKRMQQASGWREKADLVDRFNTDPAVRRQILQQYANELSQQSATAQPQAMPANSSTPPPEFVQAFKANLAPELQWMAEGQAKSFWQAQQLAMQPYLQQLQEQQVSTRASEWDSLAEQLPPGWEEHEDEMADVLTFLESPALRHPVFGSKLQLLYRLATGEAAATSQAIERMGAAAQNRVNGRGGAGQRVENNVTDRIMKSRSIRDAVQIAGRAAIEQLEAKGARYD